VTLEEYNPTTFTRSGTKLVDAIKSGNWKWTV